MADTITFRGQTVRATWPDELAAAQAVETRNVGGVEIPRLRYGKEEGLDEMDATLCDSCCAKAGEYHALGCYAEVCSKCGEPADSCDCMGT